MLQALELEKELKRSEAEIGPRRRWIVGVRLMCGAITQYTALLPD